MYRERELELRRFGGRGEMVRQLFAGGLLMRWVVSDEGALVRTISENRFERLAKKHCKLGNFIDECSG